MICRSELQSKKKQKISIYNNRNIIIINIIIFLISIINKTKNNVINMINKLENIFYLNKLLIIYQYKYYIYQIFLYNKFYHKKLKNISA